MKSFLKYSIAATSGIAIGKLHHDKFDYAINEARRFVKNRILGGEGVDAEGLTESTRVTSPKFLMSKAEEVTKMCKYAVLSTLDVFNFPDGSNSSDNNNSSSSSSSSGSTNKGDSTRRISSRTIQPFAVEFEDGSPVIYFNTNKNSRKMTDMQKNPYVSLTYLNESSMSCVAFMGTVERVPYPESLKHWEDWLYMFYPEGNNEEAGSRFTTWRIRPDKFTLISYKDQVGSQRKDSRPPEMRMNHATKQWYVHCSGKEENAVAINEKEIKK